MTAPLFKLYTLDYVMHVINKAATTPPQASRAFKRAGRITVQQAHLHSAQILLKDLSELKMAGAQDLLLAEEEFNALQYGVSKFLTAETLSPEQQDLRKRINYLISTLKKEERFGTELEVHFSHAMLAEIELISETDSTAQWLRKHADTKNIPTLFAVQKLPEHLLFWTGATAGMYFHDVDRADLIPAVFLYLHGYNDVELAIHKAHEERHAWQHETFNLDEAYSDNALDSIVWSLVAEADAQSIHQKVTWALSGLYVLEKEHKKTAAIFSSERKHTAYKHLPEKVKTQKALQAAFYAFMDSATDQNKKHTNLIYMTTAIKHALADGKDDLSAFSNLEVTTRRIATSPFLSDEALTKLSQLEDGTSYLDKQGMESIRHLLARRLAAALQKHAPKSARDPKPT